MHRPLLVTLVTAALAIACNANVVTEASGDAGAGGSGGHASTTTTTATTTSPPVTTTTSTSTVTQTTHVDAGGAGGAPPQCRHCDAALAVGLGGQALCPTSQPLWDAFQTCVCVKICPFPCGDNACKATPEPMTVECTDCIKSSCGDAYSACLADQ